MAESKSGARVWIHCDDGSTQRGTISIVNGNNGGFANDTGVMIVLDGGTTVVATTVAQRGELWDFDNEAR